MANPMNWVTETVQRNSGNQRKEEANPSPLQRTGGQKQKEQHGASQPVFDLSEQKSV